jgi:mRNA interferase YafQ
MRVIQSKQYKKSLKKILRGGKIKITEIDEVVDLLCEDRILQVKYQDHQLRGQFEGYRECHIKPDLLLIYKIEKDILVLLLINIGSHSELFG